MWKAFFAVSELPSKWLEFEHEIEIISTTLVAFSAPNSEDAPKELTAGPLATVKGARTGDCGGYRRELVGDIYSELL